MTDGTDKGDRAEFEELIAEATQQGFSGWDFSYLDEKWKPGSTSWDYPQRVSRYLEQADSLLDMGTGGGEILGGLLSSLNSMPLEAFATEGHPPNLPIAKARLEPLGVHVVSVRDCHLPWEDLRFDLVINRHEPFCASEVHRVLRQGGHFVAEQVGGRNNIELNQLLGFTCKRKFDTWSLDSAMRELEEVGFRVVDGQEEFRETLVSDMRAVIYYLNAVPWQIPGFSIDEYYEPLAAMHELIRSRGSLIVTNHRFYVEALKS